MNRQADIAKEVRDKIAETSSNFSGSIAAYDAIVRSKLLYGLETLHLTKALIRKVGAFHLRGLRKVLGLSTTFLDRANMNQSVINRANAAVAYDANDTNSVIKLVVLFSQMLQQKECR